MGAFGTLLAGDIFAAVLQLYTDVLGDYFFTIGLFVILAIIYMKTQNADAVLVIALIIGGMMSQVVAPASQMIFYAIAITSLAALLYRTLRS